MNQLLLWEKNVDTEYGNDLLEYRIHEINEEDGDFYGISIFQYRNTYEKRELFDHSIVYGFSESFEEARKFIQILAEGEVFPVHLYSIADDWKSEQTS